MTITPIKIGISTCPNDTFAFAPLLTGRVAAPAPGFEFVLMDIEELNRALFAGELDVGKASFHAALLLAETMLVLPSGSALGFGVGPLLLASRVDSRPETFTPDDPAILLCPGEHTTATLLARIFLGDLLQAGSVRIEQCLFSRIMPDLVAGKADFGVCIHEGRFTWQDQGLHFVEDFGTRWESETGLPLPLGGILASKNLSPAILHSIQTAIRDSIVWSLAHPADALPIMRKYAQEFDDNVLMKHVELYVNDWTVDLGETGRHSLRKLNSLARQSGILKSNDLELKILDHSTPRRPEKKSGRPD